MAGSVDRIGRFGKLTAGRSSSSKELSTGGTASVPSAGAGTGSYTGGVSSTVISGSGITIGVGAGFAGGGGSTTGTDTGGVGSCTGGGSGVTIGFGVPWDIGSGLETGIVVTGGGETGWAVTEPVPPETAATTLKTVLGAWDCVSVLPGSCC
ncbi:MAG: hypothetical protein WCI95_01140 [bacterium]